MIDIQRKIWGLKDRQRKILERNGVCDVSALKIENKKAWLSYISIQNEIEHLTFKMDFLNEKEKEIEKSNKGGRRVGSGRKSKTGMLTVTMRVPFALKDSISTYIDLYSELLYKKKRNVDPKKAAYFFSQMQWLEYGYNNLREKELEEEEDKRQLNLFDEQDNEKMDKKDE